MDDLMQKFTWQSLFGFFLTFDIQLFQVTSSSNPAGSSGSPVWILRSLDSSLILCNVRANVYIFNII